MDHWLLGAIVGGTAAVAVIVVQRRSSTTAKEVWPLLCERGPLTIPEIMEQLGLVGFSQQGKIVIALDSLIREGRVEERPVPPGVSTTDKISVRKYAVRAS